MEPRVKVRTSVYVCAGNQLPLPECYILFTSPLPFVNDFFPVEHILAVDDFSRVTCHPRQPDGRGLICACLCSVCQRERVPSAALQRYSPDRHCQDGFGAVVEWAISCFRSQTH